MATVSAKAKKETRTTGVSSPGANPDGAGLSCVIAQGTKIDGNFETTENMRLDGAVEGELRCQKKIVIGPNGKVTGNLEAHDAVILGQVEGNIKVSALLKLEASAVIKGDITTGALIVEQGARYDGQCKVGG